MDQQTLEPSTLVLSLPNSDNNPRNSEGAFITLNDGRIMFAYSRFTGDDWNDHASADIAARYSSDNGKTWTENDEIIVPNQGDCNIMSVSFLRLHDSSIKLFYLVKNSLLDCRTYQRTSHDEGKTWSDASCCIPAPGYFVVNNDRIVQLTNGRIIIPAAYHRAKIISDDIYKSAIDGHSIVMFFYSDDSGASWYESENWLALPQPSGSGLQEPGLIELKDGSLYAWARTDIGQQWEMRSTDKGENWSELQKSRFTSPCSPLSLKRIPSDNNLLAIWNDVSELKSDSQSSWGRTPLSAATSTDEGKTWSPSQHIETNPDHGYCYTAIHFVDDAVLLAYCSGGGESAVLQDLTMRRIPLTWFDS